jgi:hypothetical protein
LPEPRCPAEEMALWRILAAAQAMLADMAEYVADLVARLPEHPDDYDWALVFESLLQDDDIGALFSPEKDGIEDPGTDTNRDLGIGDYRAGAWFTWFQSADPRDGRRPFRRGPGVTGVGVLPHGRPGATGTRSCQSFVTQYAATRRVTR